MDFFTSNRYLYMSTLKQCMYINMSINNKKDFRCDEQSKLDFTNSTKPYISTHYPQWVVSFYGVDKNGDAVPMADSFEQSHLDLYIKCTNKNSGTNVTYAAELKERWKPYTSTSYGGEGQEGWIYNIEKDGWLNDAAKKGFTPLYVNLYEDGVIRVWNINKIDSENLPVVEKEIHKYTVKQSPKIKQTRYTLANAQAVAEYPRITYSQNVC